MRNLNYELMDIMVNMFSWTIEGWITDFQRVDVGQSTDISIYSVIRLTGKNWTPSEKYDERLITLSLLLIGNSEPNPGPGHHENRSKVCAGN